MILRWFGAPRFKRAADGGFLIFPRGRRQRGFRVPTRREWERLQRVHALTALLVAFSPAVPLNVVHFVWRSPPLTLLAICLAGALAMALNSLYWRAAVRRFEPSEETLSAQEIRALGKEVMSGSTARAALGLLAGVVTVVLAVLAWALELERWGIALLALGGPCTALSMVSLARRRAHPIRDGQR